MAVFFIVIIYCLLSVASTVEFLSIRTDRPEQTERTQLSLLRICSVRNSTPTSPSLFSKNNVVLHEFLFAKFYDVAF